MAHSGRDVSVRPLRTASIDALTVVYVPFMTLLDYNFLHRIEIHSTTNLVRQNRFTSIQTGPLQNLRPTVQPKPVLVDFSAGQSSRYRVPHRSH